jgi:hypothetical protein
MHFTQIWLWLLQTFGMPGALFVLGIAGLYSLAWIVMAVGIWGLYRRSRRIEEVLLALQNQAATQNRRQQVDRLQRDKGRNKSGPRRSP